MKFGINEAEGSGPAYDRLKAIADAYPKKSGSTVELNAVDHNTFQESINTYLQGTPDDVFTWFAGFRMQQLAEDRPDHRPQRPVADRRPERLLQGGGHAADGKQYFVPVRATTRGRSSTGSRSSRRTAGPHRPATTSSSALMKDMQGKGITPFAFGDKDGWPAMGTFDILNMRLNGFDFHMSLMAGDEAWDSAEVKQVFATWRDLLPYHQEDPLGRTWQEAATSMAKGECGMYLLGTFVADAIPDVIDDLDFFTFPELDASIGTDALDAPIDGFCLAAAGRNQDAGKEMLKWLGTRRGGRRGQRRRGSRRSSRPTPTPSTASYSDLQKKSAEVVGAGCATSPSSWTATPTPTSPRP